MSNAIRLQARFEALAADGAGDQREYQAVLVAAGRIRNSDGSPGRYEVTADAVRNAVNAGMFEARAAFVDHAGAMASPSLRDLFGVWHSTYYDEMRQAAVGTLRVFKTDATRPVVQLLDDIMSQPERMRPDVGVSIVFYPEVESGANQYVTRVTGFRAVESADMVFLPAVETSRILAALEAQQPAEVETFLAPAAEGESDRMDFAAAETEAAEAVQTADDAQAEAQPEPEATEAADAQEAPAKEDESQEADAVPDAELVAETPTDSEPPITEAQETEAGAAVEEALTDDELQPGEKPSTEPAVEETQAEAVDEAPTPEPATEVAAAPKPPATTKGSQTPGPLGSTTRVPPPIVPARSPAPSRPAPKPPAPPAPSGPAASSSPDIVVVDDAAAEAVTYTAMTQTDAAEPIVEAEPVVAAPVEELTEASASAPKVEITITTVTIEPEDDESESVSDPESIPDPEDSPEETPTMTNEAEDTKPKALVEAPVVSPVPQQQSEWMTALQQASAKAIINTSGLPTIIQERLSRATYNSPAEVEAAIEEARREVATLQEGSVIQMGGQAPRGSGIVVTEAIDEARRHIEWLLGVRDVKAPPSNMRRFDQLYVALTGDVEFRGMFDGSRVLFAGATTATLPNIAADALNKVIMDQMIRMDHWRWFERIVSVEANDGSLNDMKWITMGGLSNLPTVEEGSAYLSLAVEDAKETAAFVKRGGYVGITREMIRGSNLMQLQAIPRGLANAAIRTRSAAVSAIFTANSGVGPTLLQDTKALFHTDHKNLATAALDTTSWRAARAEAFKHQELNSGAALGIYPRFLLVPAELYDTALSLLGYGEGMPTVYTPEAIDRGFADPRAIPLVVPDWADQTNWGYIVDPAVYPVIQMSYAQTPGGGAHPAPEVFAVVSETSGLMFTNDTLPIKVRDEFAVGVNGPRGIGKRNVAG